MQAFILAAGKGERLLPYTKLLPKPLFPILGKPILELHLLVLQRLGINRVGINLFHLKEKIKDFLLNFNQSGEIELILYEEDRLLGTGGGLYNAKNFFSLPTLIINSDILHNFPLERLIAHHRKGKNHITMVCVKNKAKFNVKIDEATQRVLSFRVPDANAHYVGIQLVEPEIFVYLENDFDLITAYTKTLTKGLRIGTIIADEFTFIDIGTVENYLFAHQAILVDKLTLPFIDTPETSFIIKSIPKADIKVDFQRFAYIDEECKFLDNVTLRGVIAWRGARIPGGFHENKVFVQ